MTTTDRDERETEKLIAEIRSLEPAPGIDPPWDQMARDIFTACDAVDAKRSGGWLTAVRRWMSPQHVVVGAVGAVVAVALLVLIRGGEAEHTRSGDVEHTRGGEAMALAAHTDAGAQPHPAPAGHEAELLREASLEDMNPEELSLLADALRDPATVLDVEQDEDGLPDDVDGVLDDEPVLGPGVLAEAETAEDEEEDPTGNELPGYEYLLDDLSETALDDLDAAIDDELPG